MKRDVSVVVVNWNGGADTVTCLQSLIVASPRPARVIVVDNGSVDDSLDKVGAWAANNGVRCQPAPLASASIDPSDWLIVVKAPSNLGFSRANNAALALLRSSGIVSDVLLLNNDATIAPDFLAAMAEARLSEPGAAILGATIYRMPATDEVWFAGGRVIPLRALVAHELETPSDRRPRSTDFITGCAMLITSEALDRLGFLPDCYTPGYMEDAEYCWRAKNAGIPVTYVPGAVAYHRVGASFGRIPAPTVTYTQNRNRVFFVRRNFLGALRLGALTYLAVTKPARALVELVKGRPAQASAVFRGAWDGFRIRNVLD